jgi:Na+-transporting NADH:ubiquinone oxidoreductase subunit NqrF
MYVVAIQLDDDTTDYKVFEKSTDAIARFDRYHLGQTVRKRDKSEVEILSMSMYKAKTADVREAVRLVKAGEAERFYKPLSPEEEADISKI